MYICNNAIQKHHWCKKSEAKSEAPFYVAMVFMYMRLKGVISDRGQGLLKSNHIETCKHAYFEIKQFCTI